MRIGVFGGTFDPPHIGHQILAEEALDQLSLDHVLWVLTATPPHKPDREITPLNYRLQMVEAAIGENPRFVLSRVDIDRPAPHYALDTLRILGANYPDGEIFYLIGGDSLGDLPAWHEPQALVEACSGLGIMRRPSERIDLQELEKVIPGVSAKAIFINAPLLELSSSEIRFRIREGKPYKYYLPSQVYQVIKSQKLYQNKTTALL